MSETQKPIGWSVSGFRRYRPENRISRGMVTAAPWVDLALLVVLYLFLRLPWVLQPGVRIRLPESPFADGTRYGHTVVVQSRELPGRPERQEIVFFDDQRYLASEPAQMDELRAAFTRVTRDKPELPLILELDERVGHGTLVRLLNMAADAGLREVNLATRPGPAR